MIRFIKKLLGILLVSALVFFLVFLFWITPQRDKIRVKELPSSYFALIEENYVPFQTGEDCAGYAAAYVLRHVGFEANGMELYQSMSYRFGDGIAVRGVCEKLREYGLTATAYTGTIHTLKMQLQKGIPVIAFVNIVYGNRVGKHYVAVVGYDENYFYLADSTGRATNVPGVRGYNRKLTYEEFEELWETNSYPVNNIYIVVEQEA